MTALSWGGFVLVVVLFAWATCIALLLLNKIVASPGRDISIRIRLCPWPRIEIEAKTVPHKRC
ncbi:hypothetical protein [Amycolatopsis nigrescens]|uniref:hypothetical protein n=1 Tax=Amycolatopsis nigrescens TaxID=381445 RepID=UPI00036F111E|nr:hypothetical protein [Amycolatopsis nigrescens]